MKWFFCWCQETEFAEDHNWKELIQASVASAQANTDLEPNFIYDGAPTAFTDALTRNGVNVIFHRLSFEHLLVRHSPNDRNYQAVARGAFLRFDIPLLAAPSDGIVLYTDADVMFMSQPDFAGYAPALVAAAPQFVRGRRSDMNSGVMLINVPALRAAHEALIGFTAGNLHLGLDQEVLRAFLGDEYLLLPDIYNWKPYWGYNEDAVIVHWHGPKPQTIGRLLDGTIQNTHGAWQPLFEADKPAYRHYLNEHKKLLEEFGRQTRRAAEPRRQRWAAAQIAHVEPPGPFDSWGMKVGPPSWLLDLGDIFGISEIRLLKKPGATLAAPRFAIEIGNDVDATVGVFDGAGAEPDDEGYVYRAAMPILGRFIRIGLVESNGFELNEVEVFGAPLPSFIPRGLLQL